MNSLRIFGFQINPSEATVLKKVELFSLMDVDFRTKRLNQTQIERLTALSNDNCPLLKQFTQSYQWVFNWDSGTENSLPGTRRFGLTAIAKKHHLKDASLLVAEEFGVGILCIHHRTIEAPDLDGAIRKIEETNTNAECWENGGPILKSLGFERPAFERQYPITGIELEIPSLEDFLRSEQEALKIARLYTGGNNEFESNAILLEHLEKGGLSQRIYERFYLRWTDALAVYDEGIRSDFDTAFLRCVLIYETCALIRRILLTSIKKMDELSGSMSVFPRPFAFNHLTESVAHLRAELINAPPVQSEEAARLLRGAYDRFGIHSLAEASIERSKLLESRFQWSKSQALAALAVMTFLLKELHFFDWFLDFVRHLRGLAHSSIIR
jgi:hypothetical protein